MRLAGTVFALLLLLPLASQAQRHAPPTPPPGQQKHAVPEADATLLLLVGLAGVGGARAVHSLFVTLTRD